MIIKFTKQDWPLIGLTLAMACVVGVLCTGIIFLEMRSEFFGVLSPDTGIRATPASATVRHHRRRHYEHEHERGHEEYEHEHHRGSGSREAET
jgi:hypothetical protein